MGASHATDPTERALGCPFVQPDARRQLLEACQWLQRDLQQWNCPVRNAGVAKLSACQVPGLQGSEGADGWSDSLQGLVITKGLETQAGQGRIAAASAAALSCMGSPRRRTR